MKKHITLAIMLNLLDGQRHTAPSLADKNEVSIKTIYRAIDTLLEANMPIVSFQGKNGGYQLISQSQLSSGFFTMQELNSFITFLKSNSQLIPSSVSIQERINSLSSQTLKKTMTRQSPIIIDTNNWGYASFINENQEKLSEAINNQSQVEITYQNKGGVEKRTLFPYTLVYKTGSLYVYGVCKEKEAFRLFKLSRIKNIEMKCERFEKVNIDLSNNPWNIEFEKNLEQIEIEIMCSEHVLQDVCEWLKQYQTKKMGSNFHVKARAINSIGLIHRIMQFGEDVIVLKPEGLKRKLVSECFKICDSYNISSNLIQTKNALSK